MADDKNPPDQKPLNVTKLLRDLQSSDEMRHQPVSATGLAPHLALLRQWQSQRLARTYADMLEDKRFRPACQFFLDEIYGPRDFSQRDHDVERLHSFLSRVVPAVMIQLLTQSVELNRITNALDQRLAQVLVENLGVTDTITPELYAEGYRICDNFTERAHQIDLIHSVIEQVSEGARSRAGGPCAQERARPGLQSRLGRAVRLPRARVQRLP